MPLIILLLALFVPRIVIAVLWFLTAWFEGMFNGWVIPLLGFLFLPYTILWFSVVVNQYGGTWGTLQIVVLIIAIICDLAPLRRSH